MSHMSSLFISNDASSSLAAGPVLRYEPSYTPNFSPRAKVRELKEQSQVARSTYDRAVQERLRAQEDLRTDPYSPGGLRRVEAYLAHERDCKRSHQLALLRADDAETHLRTLNFVDNGRGGRRYANLGYFQSGGLYGPPFAAPSSVAVRSHNIQFSVTGERDFRRACAAPKPTALGFLPVEPFVPFSSTSSGEQSGGFDSVPALSDAPGPSFPSVVPTSSDEYKVPTGQPFAPTSGFGSEQDVSFTAISTTSRSSQPSSLTVPSHTTLQEHLPSATPSLGSDQIPTGYPVSASQNHHIHESLQVPSATEPVTNLTSRLSSMSVHGALQNSTGNKFNRYCMYVYDRAATNCQCVF